MFKMQTQQNIKSRAFCAATVEKMSQIWQIYKILEGWVDYKRTHSYAICNPVCSLKTIHRLKHKFLLLLQLHLFLPQLSHATSPTHGHDGEDLHMSPILVSQFQVVRHLGPLTHVSGDQGG